MRIFVAESASSTAIKNYYLHRGPTIIPAEINT